MTSAQLQKKQFTTFIVPVDKMPTHPYLKTNENAVHLIAWPEGRGEREVEMN